MSKPRYRVERASSPADLVDLFAVLDARNECDAVFCATHESAALVAGALEAVDGLKRWRDEAAARERDSEYRSPLDHGWWQGYGAALDDIERSQAAAKAATTPGGSAC